MTRFLHESDADRSLLQGATVGVVGFGNQGAAQARCLRDEGIRVLVFLPQGSGSREHAAREGFALGAPHDLARCDAAALLAPDSVHAEILETLVAPHARPGALLVFAHGFALREGARARADLDVVIVGPLGPGALLRERYAAGSGLPGLLAVVHDASGSAHARGLAYASRIGLTRAGVMETTLDEEVVSDLFVEQAVLVGGAVELVRAAWETLVEGGVSEEIAYYCCVHEMKQILDLAARDGIAGMRAQISETARYGGLTRGPRIVGEEARAAMRAVLDEVRSGRFAMEWRRERDSSGRVLAELMAREADHPMERSGALVHKELRAGVDSPEGNA